MEIRIPEEKISEIRIASNILDVISERVLLKKTGKNWTGLCPFHSEKTPSFTVSPDKQIYYCFGCGAGGNVFSFLMKLEGLSFVEVLKTLASRYRIDIPEKELTPSQKRRISEREKFFEINSLACSFFRSNLFSDSTEAGNARGYLEKRSINSANINAFGIGYASDSWDSLLRFLKSKNISPEIAERIGLAVKNKNGGLYDRFRNRIVFPISDVSGRITGFGGRVLDDSKPKYLNSPETALYHKGKSLYALNLAKEKSREEGVVYISEGYLDIVSLHQFGITNSVATLGTALTSDQVRILKGYATSMVLVYDSDEAGRSAAVRSAEVFIREGVDAYVLLLPEGHDPDSFVREKGLDGFKQAAESKKSIMDFFIDEGIRKHGASVAGRVKVVESVCSVLSHVNDRIERSLYAKQASLRLGIDPGAFLEKLEKKNTQESSPVNRVRPVPKIIEADGLRMERMIVSMMLQFPDADVIAEIKKRNLVDLFSDEKLKFSALTILETYSEKSGSDLASDVLGRIDEGLKSFIAELGVCEHPWTIEGCMGLINQFQSKRRRGEKDLLERIKEAEMSNDQVLLLKLLKEKQELVRRNRT